MSKADRAEELFRMGYNCGQSVFAAFADELGMQVETAARMASPFGAGFGKLREVCGAVSGMTMLVGLMAGYDDPADAEGKKALYALEQKMCGEFEAEMGSIICRDLLGLQKGEDLAEPAIRTEEYYQSRPCVKACRVAAEIAEKYLFGESQEIASPEEGMALGILVRYTFPDKACRDGFYEACCDAKIAMLCNKEEGCLRYEYEVPEEDTVLLLHEEWETAGDQERHLQSTHMGFVKGYKTRFRAETEIEKF